MDLEHPAPRQGTAREDFQALLAEWLTSWFDGTTKPYAEGGAMLDWPVLTDSDLAFGQFALPPNFNGVHLGLQVVGQGETRHEVASAVAGQRRFLVETRVLVLVYVRACIQTGNEEWQNSDDALTTHSGLLTGLLDSTAAFDALNAKTVYLENPRHSALPNNEGCAMDLITFQARYHAFHS